MFEFLETLAPENEERLPDKRVDKIKTSVLSRIEEDKPMKKHFTIKPLLIAAAITAIGAISAISAGAVTPPAISDETLPAATDAAQPEAPAEPAAPDTPAASENDSKPDTTPKKADSADSRIELSPLGSSDSVSKMGTISKFTLEADGTYFEYEGKTMKIIEEKASDMKLIGVDADGTRHYKSRYGGTVSHWCTDGDSCDGSDWSTAIFVQAD